MDFPDIEISHRDKKQYENGSLEWLILKTTPVAFQWLTWSVLLGVILAAANNTKQLSVYIVVHAFSLLLSIYFLLSLGRINLFKEDGTPFGILKMYLKKSLCLVLMCGCAYTVSHAVTETIVANNLRN